MASFPTPISNFNIAASLSGDEFIPISQRNQLTGKLTTVYTTPYAIASYALRNASTPSAPSNTEALLVPVGVIFPYAGKNVDSNSIPAGWLLCDGSAVSKSAYSNLYSIIGDTYGTTNFTTLFKLPDLRARFIMGYGTTAATFTPNFGNWPINSTIAVGNSGGEYFHQITSDEMPSHTHPISDPTHRHVYAGDDMWPAAGQLAAYGIERAPGVISYDANSRSGGAPMWYTAPSTTNISISSTGGNLYHNNLPPYVVMNYIIKY